jgi:multidrug efflux system membrane fusion protein
MQGGTPLSVAASDRSNSDVLAKGSLAALDNQVDTATGTVKLRAQFDNADLSLFPNQFVNAKLTVRVLHDAVVIPSAAVLTGAPGSFVYKLGDDGTVSVQTVTPGPTDGETTSITAGLSPGDVVVIDGTDRLKDGAKVTVVTDSGAGATPAGTATPSKHHHRHHHASDQSDHPAQE